MDIESVRKNYRNFEDYQIIDLANSAANSLRPEIIPILEEEIKRRNLSETLLSGIKAQLKVPTASEIDFYISLIQNQSCSDCNSKTKKINGAIINDVASIIFLTRTSSKIKITCSDCIEKTKSTSNNKTLLLGWWAFPWGPIKTIQTLFNNSKMVKKIHTNQPSEVLQAFVYENIGILESNKDNPDAIKNLLFRTNNPA